MRDEEKDRLFKRFVLTETDRREHRILELKIAKELRSFYVSRMHKHGMSNAAIADELGLSEALVRSILSKVGR